MTKSTAVEKAAPAAMEPTREDRPVFVPAVDIYEREDAILVRCDMPGVDEKDLEITLEDNVLTLTGPQQTGVPEGYENVTGEYQAGVYHRAFTIAQEIDQSRIKASMKHGVLDIQLPKSEETQPRRIEVHVES
jgi:HSP20 family molecular chaperone IbpA